VAGQGICRQGASIWPTVSAYDFHVESLFHYVDDFITVGKPDSPECGSNMSIMRHTCQETGTSVEEDKCEGPATIIPFLGIELVLEICLPADKLQQLRNRCTTGEGRKQPKGNCYPLFDLFSMPVKQFAQVD